MGVVLAGAMSALVLYAGIKTTSAVATGVASAVMAAGGIPALMVVGAAVVYKVVY
jgi:hypothetical protein